LPLTGVSDFFNSYLLHLVDKQTGNLSLFSDHLLIKILPTPILVFAHNNLCFLVRAKITKKKKSLGNKRVVKRGTYCTEQDCKDLNDVNDGKEVHVVKGQGNFLIP